MLPRIGGSCTAIRLNSSQLFDFAYFMSLCVAPEKSAGATHDALADISARKDTEDLELSD
jgi:hypothetical protein